jgi:hypothetical protein
MLLSANNYKKVFNTTTCVADGAEPTISPAKSEVRYLTINKAFFQLMIHHSRKQFPLLCSHAEPPAAIAPCPRRMGTRDT